jgi:hypothetical protein
MVVCGQFAETIVTCTLHDYPYLPNRSARLPPILPTRAIHTPLRLLTNVLPAELALDLLLYDVVV